jgi:hypothetical protein
VVWHLAIGKYSFEREPFTIFNAANIRSNGETSDDFNRFAIHKIRRLRMARCCPRSDGARTRARCAAPGYLTPHWYRVKPFALERSDMFRPPPPPKVGSEQLKKEIDEVVNYLICESDSNFTAGTVMRSFW